MPHKTLGRRAAPSVLPAYHEPPPLTGPEIADWRRREYITATDLARAVGIAPGLLLKYERQGTIYRYVRRELWAILAQHARTHVVTAETQELMMRLHKERISAI